VLAIVEPDVGQGDDPSGAVGEALGLAIALRELGRIERMLFVAVPVAARLGACQPDRRLPVAQRRQTRRWQIQAATTNANGLTCFIFRFLKGPLDERCLPRTKL